MIFDLWCIQILFSLVWVIVIFYLWCLICDFEYAPMIYNMVFAICIIMSTTSFIKILRCWWFCQREHHIKNVLLHKPLFLRHSANNHHWSTNWYSFILDKSNCICIACVHVKEFAQMASIIVWTFPKQTAK